ncbi:MAG: DUF5372 family protein, partial [Solirubrobacteraceae bacterium]
GEPANILHGVPSFPASRRSVFVNREGTPPSSSRVSTTSGYSSGPELEFVKRRNNWRADRVYVRDDADGLVSLPAEWTDAVAEDPFVVVASGCAPCHLEGLLALAELVTSLVAARSSAEDRAASETSSARRQADYAAPVSKILPHEGQAACLGRTTISRRSGIRA